MQKEIITAESQDGTQFYYNWDKQTFEQHDKVDIWMSDHFNAEFADKESAKAIAENEGLAYVMTECFHD